MTEESSAAIDRVVWIGLATANAGWVIQYTGIPAEVLVMFGIATAVVFQLGGVLL